MSMAITILTSCRNGRTELEQLDRQIEHISNLFDADIRKLSTPNVDVSSSMIRDWLRQGRSCKYYLMDEQIEYIRREGIYQ